MDSENPQSGQAPGASAEASSSSPPLSSIAVGIPRISALRRMARESRADLENLIAVAIDALDAADGDPDDEPNGDDEAREADGDTRDAAWIEWHQMRGSQKRGPNIASQNEDDEDDDPAEEDDDPGQNSEDELSSGKHSYGWRERGPGCELSDPGGTYGIDC